MRARVEERLDIMIEQLDAIQGELADLKEGQERIINTIKTEAAKTRVRNALVHAGFSGHDSFDFVREYWTRAMMVYSNAGINDKNLTNEENTAKNYDTHMEACKIAYYYW